MGRRKEHAQVAPNRHAPGPAATAAVVDASPTGNIAERLVQLAGHAPAAPAFRWIKANGAPGEHYTYAQLDAITARVAHRLVHHYGAAKGDRCVMCFMPGLEFVICLYACQRAGLVPVPVTPAYPQRFQSGIRKIDHIIQDSGAEFVLTDAAYKKVVALKKIGRRAGSGRTWLTVPWHTPVKSCESASHPRLDALADLAPSDLAFLQYTSGSTGNPKGVMVSHQNLIAQVTLLRDHSAFAAGQPPSIVAWLPMYHDMGLIGVIFMSVFTGGCATLMSPLTFLKRPFLFAKAMSDFKGTHTAVPNFALHLLTTRVKAEEIATLDLSNLRTLVCGAEPINPGTVERFFTAYKDCGFCYGAFSAAFGLAEHVLMVSTRALGRDQNPGPAGPVFLRADRDALQHELVYRTPGPAHEGISLSECGTPCVDVRIVDPESMRERGEDAVGEVWVSSSSVASGYYNRPEATRETFQATLATDPGKHFLRTGDLGFLHDTRLYITSRMKDLIIVSGVNYFPQDLETVAEGSHQLVRKGCVIAFATRAPDAVSDEVVVVAEVRVEKKKDKRLPEVAAAIASAIGDAAGLSCHTVGLLMPRTIPKTSSGKVTRQPARRAFEDGSLPLVFRFAGASAPRTATDDATPAPAPTTARTDEPVASAPAPAPATPPSPSKPAPLALAAQPAAPSPSALQLQREVAGYAAEVLGTDVAAVDLDANMSSLLTSIQLVSLSAQLSDALGRDLEPEVMYEVSTLRELCAYLAHDSGRASAAVLDGIDAAVALPPDHQVEVAAIGIGCRAPHAGSPHELWDAVLMPSRATTVDKPPPGRFPPGFAFPASYLPDPIDRFDGAFFGISAAEQQYMDFHHLVLLECAWHAIEDAGVPLAALQAARTGVFVGQSNADFGLLSGACLPPTGFQASGASTAMSANRLSYTFGLGGPSMVMDTACSSSLVAVDAALKAMRAGEIDYALVAGANLLLSASTFETLATAGFLAPDGRCKTFDAAADGYVRGEGCGVVLLHARTGGAASPSPPQPTPPPRTYGIVAGAAVNSDGHSNGITAPSPAAQRQVLAAAYADARVSPASLAYLEAHGTGTRLGDHIELSALQAVFADSHPTDHRLPVGSIKTNLGHLEGAAGIFGLIKALLVCYHARVPPSLNFDVPNPLVPWDSLCLEVPVQPRSIGQGRRPEEGPFAVGVSSFGFGGTNAHVVLLQPADAPGTALDATTTPHTAATNTEAAAAAAAAAPLVLPLCASSSAALGELAGRYADVLATKAAPLGAVCRGAQLLRPVSPHMGAAVRAAFVAATAPDMAAELRLFAQQAAPSAADEPQPRPPTPGSPRPPVCFLFPGQGAQYPGMAQALYRAEPVFREAMDACDALVTANLGSSLLAVAFGNPDPSESEKEGGDPVHETRWAQPAIFAVEYSLSRLLAAWGVKPDVVVGHSLGEFTAACIAGIWTLEDALRVVCERGRLMGRLPPSGGMVAMKLSAAAFQALDAAVVAGTTVASVNGPESIVVSGAADAVARLKAHCAASGIKAKVLPVQHAFHSPPMRPLVDGLAGVLAEVAYSEPTCTFLACAAGRAVDPAQPGSAAAVGADGRSGGGEHGGRGSRDDPCGPEYWKQHAVRPVLFSQCIQLLGARPGAPPIGLEVGPQPALLPMAAQHDLRVAWVPTLKKGGDDQTAMAACAKHLFEAGQALAWPRLPGPDAAALPATILDLLPACVFDHAPPTFDSVVALHNAAAASRGGASPHVGLWHLGLSAPRAVQAPATDPVGAARLDSTVLVVSGPANVSAEVARLTRDLQRRGATAHAAGDAASLALDVGKSVHLVHVVVSPANFDGRGLAAAGPSAEAMAALDGVVRAVRGASASNHAPATCSLLLLIRSSAPSVSLGLGAALLNGVGRTLALELSTLAACAVGQAVLAPGVEPAVAVLEHLALLPAETEAVFVPCDGTPSATPSVCFPRVVAVEALGAPTTPEAGCWVVSGGTGFVGLSLAEVLVEECNATGIVLLSRRGKVGDTLQDELLALQQRSDARVQLVKCDVTDKTRLSAALDTARDIMGPVVGVVHAAGHLDGEPLGGAEAPDWGRFAGVLQTKLAGAEALAELTARDGALLILCSSVAAAFGAVNNASYAAANRQLDALSDKLRAQGRHALSLQWGPLEGRGMAAAKGTRPQLEALGLPTLSKRDAQLGFAQLLHTDLSALPPAVIIASRAIMAAPALAGLAALKDLAPRQASGGGQPSTSAAAHATTSPTINLDTLARVWAKYLPSLPTTPDRTLDFYEVGGSSLSAIQMLNELRDQHGLGMELAAFFRSPTMGTILDAAGGSEHGGAPAEARADGGAGAAADATLLPLLARACVAREPFALGARQCALVVQTLNGDSKLARQTYNIGAAVRFEGPVDIPRLQAAVAVACLRHELLRARIRALELEVTGGLPSMAHASGVDSLAAAEAWAGDLLSREYDLEGGALFRVGLACVRGDAQQAVFVLGAHHAIADGYSLSLVATEIITQYAGGDGAAAALGPSVPAPRPYSEFAALDQRGGCDPALATFWADYLGDGLPLGFLGDRANIDGELGPEACLHVPLPPGPGRAWDLEWLQSRALAAVRAVLWQETGECDAVVGILQHGRGEDWHTTVGHFATQHAIRHAIAPGAGRVDLDGLQASLAVELARTRDRAALPFSELVRVTGTRGLHQPVFRVSFNHMPAHGAATAMILGTGALEARGATLEAALDGVPFARSAQHDLSVELRSQQQGAVLSLRYNTLSFTPKRVADLAQRMVALVRADPTAAIAPPTAEALAGAYWRQVWAGVGPNAFALDQQFGAADGFVADVDARAAAGDVAGAVGATQAGLEAQQAAVAVAWLSAVANYVFCETGWDGDQGATFCVAVRLAANKGVFPLVLHTASPVSALTVGDISKSVAGQLKGAAAHPQGAGATRAMRPCPFGLDLSSNSGDGAEPLPSAVTLRMPVVGDGGPAPQARVVAGSPKLLGLAAAFEGVCAHLAGLSAAQRAGCTVLLLPLVVRPEARLEPLPTASTGALPAAADSALLEDGGACVFQLFEEAAARFPDRTALVDHRGAAAVDAGTAPRPHGEFTYAEVNEWANRLAALLMEQGVGVEDRVLVAMEPCPAMVAALLGVMKAGAAYVAMDPAWPAPQLAAVVGDSGAQFLCVHGEPTALLRGLGCTLVDADRVFVRRDRGAVTPNPGRGGVTPQSLAYTLYTSGTTGRPKGVVVEHAGVANLLRFYHGFYGRGPTPDRQLLVVSFTFDHSVRDLFVPLTCGATVVLAQKLDLLEGINGIVAEHGVTHLGGTPGMLGLVDPRAATTVRCVLCGGEAMPQSLADAWAPRAELWNVYGPTEATVDAIVRRVGSNDGLPISTIGRPLPGMQAHVLDPTGRALPRGFRGLLWLAGVQLARGYHNLQEKTDAAFVDPRALGGRLYNTGDVAEVARDGAVRCYGRVDHQIKLRGFRIELTGIEATLNEHDLVRESVVVLDSERQRLVAFVRPSPSADGAVSEASLRAFLGARLRPYQVPARVVVRDSFPLTSGGKVDRKRLLASQREGSPVGARVTATERDSKREARRAQGPAWGHAEHPANADAAAAPSSSMVVAAGVWCSVLGTIDPQPEDDFFEQGGDSIKAVSLVERLNQQGLRVSLRAFFADPTLASLSSFALTPDGDQEALVEKARARRASFAAVSGSARRRRSSSFHGRGAVPKDEVTLVATEPFRRTWILICGELVLGLLAIGVVVSPAAVFVRLLFSIRESHGVALAVGMVPFVWTAFCFLAAGLVAGSYRLLRLGLGPGVYRVNSVSYARFWAGRRLFGVVRALFLDALTGTQYPAWFFRLCGAKIGRNVTLSSLEIDEPAFVSIGDDVLFDTGAHICCSTVTDGEFIVHNARIGDSCHIEHHAVIQGLTRLVSGVHVPPRVLVRAGTTLLDEGSFCPHPSGLSHDTRPSPRPGVTGTSHAVQPGELLRMALYPLLGWLLVHAVTAGAGASTFYATTWAVEGAFDRELRFEDGYISTAVLFTFSLLVSPFLAPLTPALAFVVVEFIWDFVMAEHLGGLKALAVLFAFAGAAFVATAVGIVVLRRLLLLAAGDRFRKHSARWALRWTAELAMGQAFSQMMSLLSGTVYYSWWLRLNGARLDHLSRINWCKVTQPELLRMKGASFLGGASGFDCRSWVPEPREGEAGDVLPTAGSVPGRAVWVAQHRECCLEDNALLGYGAHLSGDSLHVLKGCVIGAFTAGLPSKDQVENTVYMGSPAAFALRVRSEDELAATRGLSLGENLREMFYSAIVVLIAFLSVLAATLPSQVFLFWLLDRVPTVVFALVIPVAVFGTTLLLLLISVVWKRLLFGKLHAQHAMHSFGFNYARVQVVVRLNYVVRRTLSFWHGSWVLNACAWFAGARIGRHVFMDCAMPSEPDLLSIGDHAVLDRCSLWTHSYAGFSTVYRNITIGPGCHVGALALLSSETELGSSVQVAPAAVVLSGSRLAHGKFFAGNPAEAQQSAQLDYWRAWRLGQLSRYNSQV